MSDSMTAAIVIDAHRMAVARRGLLSGLIMHDDRGPQNARRRFRDEVRRLGIVSSMSRKGDCWDNAVVESFNATIKTELIHREEWETRDSARTVVYEYVETWYNPA